MFGVAVLALLAVRESMAVTLTASYDGQLTVADTHETAAVAGALGEANAVVNGTVAIGLKDPQAGGVFYVRGKRQGPRVRLVGANGSRIRFRWVGQVSGDTLVGKLRLSGPSGRLRGRLALQRRAVVQPPGGTTPCDPVYFADPMMTTVLVPICAGCHGAGGIAAATSFHVTPADLTATQASTNLQVDVATPSSSRLLQKPLALMPHGGGQQIATGSPEEQVLAHWADVVAAGNCGGGGGQVPTTGPELYAANCQSCHGADARGLDGRPSVRCTGAIHDVVVAGKGTGPDAMPAFPNLDDAQIALIQAYLEQLCGEGGRTGADLYAGNCATCHGDQGQGGRNSAGVNGPDVQCSSAGDFSGKVRLGDGKMPAFPELVTSDVNAIVAYVQGFCTGPIGGD